MHIFCFLCQCLQSARLCLPPCMPEYSKHCETSPTCLLALCPRIIGSGIRIKLGIWRDNLEDRHLASSLVAEDPGELGELTLSATLTQTQTRAFGEFGLKLYTDTDTQHKCSRCSCKFKRNVFILIKVVCYTYLAATTTLFKRN